MSTRAAWRLEALGYQPVHDYVGGKADWLAAGLPTIAPAPPARVVDVIDRTVPTCTYAERLVDVIVRHKGGDRPVCVVVNDQRVILGLLRVDRLAGLDPSDARPVDEVMDPGPSTIRADADLAAATDRIQRQKIPGLLVSTPDGVLLGWFEPKGRAG